MATQTLAEAAKLINNQIVQGVAEDIITTNPMWNAMPWTGYEGQAILVNRENADFAESLSRIVTMEYLR